jgi:hypothetical protein
MRSRSSGRRVPCSTMFYFRSHSCFLSMASRACRVIPPCRGCN